MSTPCAIRFINNRKKEPFAGIYIHYDCNIDFVIDCILRASRNIIPFPINIIGSDRRIKVREKAAALYGCEVKDLIFAYGVDKYAIAFSSRLFGLFDKYEQQKEDLSLKLTDGDIEEFAPEAYNFAEDFISALDLSSRYADNVVYMVDISFPKKTSIELNYEPLVTIKTGVGDEVFEGSLSRLKEERKEIIKENEF